MTKRRMNMKKVPALAAQTLDERLVYCAGMLYIWGIVTHSERLRAHKRMLKRKKADD